MEPGVVLLMLIESESWCSSVDVDGARSSPADIDGTEVLMADVEWAAKLLVLAMAAWAAAIFGSIWMFLNSWISITSSSSKFSSSGLLSIYLRAMY